MITLKLLTNNTQDNSVFQVLLVNVTVNIEKIV